MSEHQINGQAWPEGTVVSVYPAEATPAGSLGAPSGTAVTSATVSGGSVHFGGLGEGRRYVAYAAGVRRFFLVQPGSVDTMRPISGAEAQEIREDSINKALKANLAINLKDYSGDVMGGNWLPVLRDAYDTGRPIYAGEGSYDLDGELIPREWAPRLVGAGIGRTEFVLQGDDAFFSQYKSTTGVTRPRRETLETAITANLLVKGRVVSFNTAGDAAGDYVHIRSAKLWPQLDEGSVYGEIQRIISIDSGSQATLMGPVDEEYLLVDTPKIRKVTLLRGLYFADFTIRNSAPDTKAPWCGGTYINFCHHPVVENVEYVQLDANACTFRNCVGWRAEGLRCWDLTDNSGASRYGYGLYMGDGSRDGVALGCHMDNGRHSVTTGATLNEIPSRHNQVIGCSATNMNSYGFDTHGTARFTTFIGCVATNCRARGFNDRAQDTRYVGCRANNVTTGLVTAAGSGPTRVDDFEASYCTAGMNLSGADFAGKNIRISDSEGAGVILAPTATGARFENTDLIRTETLGTTEIRGISCAASDCTFINTYGEDVAEVIHYLDVTGIVERGTHGRNITVLRDLSGTVTFAQLEGEPINGQMEVNADTASIAVVPGINARRQFLTGPHGSDRQCVLSKVGAVKGDWFRVTRSAAAGGVGVFRNVLNGSAGPTIKGLAAGTWCESVFDGTDWILTAYGTL